MAVDLVHIAITAGTSLATAAGTLVQSLRQARAEGRALRAQVEELQEGARVRRAQVKELQEAVAELRRRQREVRGSIPDFGDVLDRVARLEQDARVTMERVNDAVPEDEFTTFAKEQQQSWQQIMKELGWIRGTLEARGSRR